jgi:hypothetical protein
MEVGRISFNIVCIMCVRMCMDKSQYWSAYYTVCLKRHCPFLNYYYSGMKDMKTFLSK